MNTKDLRNQIAAVLRSHAGHGKQAVLPELTQSCIAHALCDLFESALTETRETERNTAYRQGVVDTERRYAENIEYMQLCQQSHPATEINARLRMVAGREAALTKAEQRFEQREREQREQRRPASRIMRSLALSILAIFCLVGIAQAQPGVKRPGDRLWRIYPRPQQTAAAPAPVYGIYAANIYYYWSFDETGDVARVDSARGRVLNSFNGVPDTVGVVNKAASFNNSNVAHLQAADSVYTQPDSVMFVSCWFRANTSTTTQVLFVHGQHYGCGNTLRVSFLPLISSGSYVFRLCDSAETNYQFPYTIRAREWYHAAVLLLPQKDSIYVWLNDTLRASGTFANMKRLGKFYVGASGNPSFMFSFFGAIDELMCIVLPQNSAIVPRKTFVDYLWNGRAGRKFHEVRDYLKP